MGQHSIRSTIQPSGQCFLLYYVITPVDECSAPPGSPWRHRCDESARCEDTEESYNCVCPTGMEGEQGTGHGRCGGFVNTHDCCGPSGGDQCKHSFVCVSSTNTHKVDPCRGQCVETANCALLSKEGGNHGCVCQSGLFGNGRHCARGKDPPPAKFDRDGNLLGQLVAEEYCGCQTPVVDYCHGVDCGEHAVCQNVEKSHRCVCEKGYEEENGRCVDKQGVQLMLEGPEVVTLVQGDAYQEELVRIKDENGMLAEPRFISISYDSPNLNGDTIDKVGTYTITYTVKAPWTSTPTVTIKRKIVVTDLDECKLRENDPKYDKWRPQCHPWAQCINTAGGYECRCLDGTEGDGAVANASTLRTQGVFPPKNIKDGSGCRDIVPPVLEVSAWEKTFQVCKCEGLGGPNTPVPSSCPKRDYGQELSDLVLTQNLICTEGWPCFQAYDDLPDGRRQDLTSRVVMGPTTHEDVGKRQVKNGKDIRQYVLPLSVADDAGNRVESQLTFSVEEISLSAVSPQSKARGPELPPTPTPAPPKPPAPVVEKVKEKAKEIVHACAAEVPETSSSAAPELPEEEDLDGSSLLVLLIFVLIVGASVACCCSSGAPATGLGGEDFTILGSEPDDGEELAPFVYHESPTPNSSRNHGSLSPPKSGGSLSYSPRRPF